MDRTDTDPTDLGLSPAPAAREHACVNGWTGDEDHPTPCRVCRPHLTRHPDRAGAVAWRPTRTTRRTR